MNSNTGEIREFQTQSLAEAAGFAIPLAGPPDPRCKRCYGRGHTGMNLTTSKYEPCQCTTKKGR